MACGYQVEKLRLFIFNVREKFSFELTDEFIHGCFLLAFFLDDTHR